jgi:hypothetical protein
MADARLPCYRGSLIPKSKISYRIAGQVDGDCASADMECTGETLQTGEKKF